MSKNETAKTVAVVAASAVATFAAIVVGIGTYTWVKYDILKRPEEK